MERRTAMWLKIRHLLEYLVFRVFVCFLQALSMRRAVAFARAAAFVVHRVLPRKWTRYEVARKNLRTAFGDRYSDSEIDAVIHRMWLHLFRMIVEIIQLPRKLRSYNVTDVVECSEIEKSVRALFSGRPVIMLSGHFGNWEMANATFGLFGFPMGVVARDLDNPYLHEWFRRYRQVGGHQLISKKGGYDQMLDILENGGFLGMLADQDAGSRGLFVDFFGTPASTFKSIALLAIQYRAVICVGYARRVEDDFENNRWVQYELGCEEVIDPLQIEAADEVREITRRYTAALERVIRRSPEQYFWVHRRWKSVPRKSRKRAAA